MNEPKPMNEHCRLEHSDWNYLERSEDELCPVCRGEQMATERIIKLLIDKAIEWRTNDLHQQADYIDFTIDLIKGEK